MSEEADAAWAEIRRDREVRSLTRLRRVAGRPLVVVRCRRDRTLSAAVWRTSSGPLLVTGHRLAVHPVRPIKGVPGAGTFIWDVSLLGGDAVLAGSHVWVPRLVLLSEDPAAAFPLPCADCEAPLPYSIELLAADVTRALVSQPVERAV